MKPYPCEHLHSSTDASLFRRMRRAHSGPCNPALRLEMADIADIPQMDHDAILRRGSTERPPEEEGRMLVAMLKLI